MKLASFLISIAEIVMQASFLAINFNGFFKLLDGLMGLFYLKVGKSNIVVGFEELRLLFDNFVVMNDCVFIKIDGVIGECNVIVHFGIVLITRLAV